MKHCYNCIFYSQFINQGITMCTCPEFSNPKTCTFDAETCDFYKQNVIKQYPYYSTSVAKLSNNINNTGQIEQYKVNRTKKKRKNERGVKHGRRK